MHRSVIRVLSAVALVAAGGVAWADFVAAGGGKEINATVDATKCDKTWGPPCFTPSNGTVTQVTQGDTVTWKALDGTHTVTPVDPAAFGGSGDLTGPDAAFSVTFDKAGVFSFYCKHHGSVEDGGKTHHGMWGKIDVKAGGNTTTTTAPPAPPPDNQPPPTDPGPPPAPGPTRPPSPPPTSSPPPTHSNGSTAGQGSNGQGGGGQGGGGQTAAGTGRPFVGPPPTQAAPPPPDGVCRSAGHGAAEQAEGQGAGEQQRQHEAARGDFRAARRARHAPEPAVPHRDDGAAGARAR